MSGHSSGRVRSLVVFTSTRADFGIFGPLLDALRQSGVDTQLIVSGTHLSAAHGHTNDEVTESGIAIGAAVPIFGDESDDGSITTLIGRGVEAYARALDRLEPSHAVVLGDRFEAFAFATACHCARIPLAHLHGGEVTIGALDDAFRHCISKFASLHLVASAEFGQRLARLGEHPDTIHVVGALGLDAIRSVVSTSGLPVRSDQILLALHPETLSADDHEQVARRLVAAAIETGRPILATGPNADPGGEAIRRVLLEAHCAGDLQFVESLGSSRFIAELARSAVMIGNSSAGIIEAPFLGTPTLDIGGRQHGRPRAPSVTHTSVWTPDLARVIQTCASTSTSPLGPTPYGDGHAAGIAVDALLDDSNWARAPKQFFDGELTQAGQSSDRDSDA